MNMDNELRFLLEQGPTTAKELARQTGWSTSTVYKALKAGREDGTIQVHDDAGGGANRFSVKPIVQVMTTDEKKAMGAVAPVASLEVPEDGPGTIEAPEVKETPTNDAPVAPAPENGPAKRGRKATAAGQKLFPHESILGGDEPKTYVNPRRKGSAGFKSLQIIIDNPGILTEDYVKAGGRLNDLRWDLAHGNVRAE
jgi:hypothetical protein